MSYADKRKDSDDLFADTRMSFGDHIEELRTHLIRALIGFFVGMLFGFAVSPFVLDFIKAPVEQQLMKFYQRRVDRIQRELANGDPAALQLNQPKRVIIELPKRELAREIAQALGLNVPQGVAGGPSDGEQISLPIWIQPLDFSIQMSEAQRMVGRPPLLAVMGILESFMVYLKIAMVSGVVIGSPWIFYQLWLFIAAGLYPHEKKYIHLYLPFSLVLFLAGIAMCQFFVIPKAVASLLWFNEWLGLEPDLRLNEWLGFAIVLPLVFGLAFQTPLVMLFMAKFRLMDVTAFRRKRKIAWFIMALIAAAITPPDAISMLLLLLPLCGLYELGILLVYFSVKPEEEALDVPEPEEMVEV
jgi:sec-independent protein translocase protein TatC